MRAAEASARDAVFRPIGPQRFASQSGGPEGKLRGRPPPPVEPRSGPWRRTGSESGAGRARTRRLGSMTEGPTDANGRQKLGLGESLKLAEATVSGRFRRRWAAFESQFTQRQGWMTCPQLGDLLQRPRQIGELAAPAKLLDGPELGMRRTARSDEV